MNTKTITIDTDWLSEIDGLTVGDAISYLMTLNSSYKLDCHLSGDTHGCDIESSLSYEVALTNAEILANLESRYSKEIAMYQKAKVQHIKDGRTERADSCDRLLLQLNSKLESVRIKYKEK